MACKSPVSVAIALVQNQPEKVETAHQIRWHVDIFNHRFLWIVCTLFWICSCKYCCSG